MPKSEITFIYGQSAFCRQPLGQCDHRRGWMLRHMPTGFAVARPRSTTAQQTTSHLQQNTALHNPMAHIKDIAIAWLAHRGPRRYVRTGGRIAEPNDCGAFLVERPLGCEGQLFAGDGLYFVEQWSNVVELLRNRLACDATSTLANDHIAPVVVEKMRIVRR